MQRRAEMLGRSLMALVDDEEASVLLYAFRQLAGRVEHRNVDRPAAKARSTVDDIDLVKAKVEVVRGFFPPLLEQGRGWNYDERRVRLNPVDAGKREDSLTSAGH